MKHKFGPSGKGSSGTGHGVMYGKPKKSQHFDTFPDGGGYPHRFIEWAYEMMGVPDPSAVLHLCSGSMTTGVRVDIRADTKPDIVADCRKVPLPDSSFDFILADPPYSEEYAQNLYRTGDHYPKPGQICAEACRLLRPGGRFGIMHFCVPMFRKPLSQTPRQAPTKVRCC